MTVSATRAQPSPGDTVLSTKVSALRRARFQIRTDLCVDANGRRYVRKLPLNPEARPHVDAMVAHRARLAALYAGSSFVVNDCQSLPDGVAFDYVAGPTLANMALTRLRDGDRGGFLALIGTLFEAVAATAVQPFRATSEFRAVFGSPRLPPDLRSSGVTDLDLILPNLIVSEDRWHIIDYEWTVDFPVPVGFVLFRTLRYLCLDAAAAPLLDSAVRAKLVRLAGIGPSLRAFRRMEFALQLHVSPAEALLRGPDAALATPLRRMLARLPQAIAVRLLKLQMVMTPAP